MAVTPAQPYVPAAPGGETLDRVEQLAVQARASHAEFLAAAPAARRQAMAASGANTGNEAWAVAQVAIADLEARRSLAMVALADLDRVYIETSNAGEAIAPVEDARSEIIQLVEQENALIAELLAAIGG